MKILFILEYFTPSLGGVEKLFASLTQELSKENHVEVLTLKLPNTPAIQRMGGVKIHRINAFNRYFFTFLSIFKALSLAKKADVIHTTTYNAAFPAWIASKIHKKKSVITIHEVLGKNWYKLPEMNKIQAFIHRLFERFVLSLSFDQYVCVSHATKTDLLQYSKIPEEKISVIYNGIDYNKWRSHRSLEESQTKKGAKSFLYYGRPGFTKGLTYLLRAWKNVSQQNQELTLKLVLSKTPQHLYQNTIKNVFQLGVEKSVEIIDPLEEQELITLLSETNCIIIPSLTEGFGFNIVENAALGNRVIATSAGSIPEVISGQHLICDPADVEGLEQAILKATRGEFLELPLKKFEIEKTVDEYANLYEAIA